VRELYHKRVRMKCADEVRGEFRQRPEEQCETKQHLADMFNHCQCNRLRRLLYRPHLHRNHHVSDPTEGYEHLHDALRHTIRNGRCTCGVVCNN
jgi:hypothetical protein